MGLEGFSNNASGGMSPGDHLYAKTFNKLATSADKAQVGPSDGLIFTATNGGIGMYIPQQTQEQAASMLQQFEIVVEPYFVAGEDTGLSIIRVVKGEVVWCPKLLQLPPPAPEVISCTTQTTIENWFALPTFPIIDDENAAFIGDGGIRVPKVAGITIGIFIFKATNLPVDIDPIIVAVPDYVPSCPVVFPGTPPVAGAFWEVVKIGSVIYVEPDPESDPPIEGGWEITQNFIGSMTLPGDGGSSEQGNKLPPQLPSNTIPKASPMPFECRIEVDSGGDMLLRVGNGSVSYTKSNMPAVKTGCISNRFQNEYTSIQAVPSGWRKDGSSSDGWMQTGGGYKISGEGQWYLCAAYWDATAYNNFNLPAPLVNERPFLALIDAYGADVDKLFVETGPGLYTQTMNIQSMDGYKASQTELAGDWMHCHSTWFNPMKLGYDIKIIARIESRPADSSVAQIFTYQTSTTTRNEIQNIYFPVLPKDGFVTFSYDGVPATAPFYPSPWSGFNDSTSLFNCLQTIPALTGNITVTRTSDNNFYITFINALQATNVPTIVVAVNALQSWPYEYVIDQYHIGNLVLETSPKFDGTQIMNKEDVTEEQDPYTLQEQANPSFPNLVNRQDIMACDNLSGDTNFNDGIFPVVDNEVPRAVTANAQSYVEANGCTGEACEYPFQVHPAPAEGDTESVWSVCHGMVNNQVPTNIEDTFAGDNMFIYLQVPYDSATKSFPQADAVTILFGATVPASTNAISYIAIAQIVGGKSNQLVSGSLWGDRIQIGYGGTETAQYYYAKV